MSPSRESADLASQAISDEISLLTPTVGLVLIELRLLAVQFFPLFADFEMGSVRPIVNRNENERQAAKKGLILVNGEKVRYRQ